MKKAFILNILLFVTIRASCQDYFNCDYKIIHGNYVITPSMSNLLGLFLIPGDQFKFVMDKYDYKLTTDRHCYIASTEGSPFYTIQKTGRDVVMIYSVDDGNFAEILKRELRNKNISYTFTNNGARVYKCKIPIEGIYQRYSFYVEETNGSCVIGMKLEN